MCRPWAVQVLRHSRSNTWVCEVCEEDFYDDAVGNTEENRLGPLSTDFFEKTNQTLQVVPPCDKKDVAIGYRPDWNNTSVFTQSLTQPPPRGHDSYRTMDRRPTYVSGCSNKGRSSLFLSSAYNLAHCESRSPSNTVEKEEPVQGSKSLVCANDANIRCSQNRACDEQSDRLGSQESYSILCSRLRIPQRD